MEKECPYPISYRESAVHDKFLFMLERIEEKSKKRGSYRRACEISYEMFRRSTVCGMPGGGAGIKEVELKLKYYTTRNVGNARCRNLADTSHASLRRSNIIFANIFYMYCRCCSSFLIKAKKYKR